MRVMAVASFTAAMALLGLSFATAQEPISLRSDCPILPQSKCPGSDLRAANFAGSIMAMMVLTGANLERANLQGANLWKAELARANLSQADLAQAFLTGANLRGADLSRADLRRAFLFGAFAEGADFSGAQLEGARWLTGALCGPGSIGECRPVAADAAVEAPMQYGPAGGVYPDLPAAAKADQTIPGIGGARRRWLRFLGSLLAGAAGAALGWIMLEFVGRPIRRFYDLRGEVINTMAAHADLRARHGELSASGIAELQVKDELRDLAARLRSFAHNEAFARRVLLLLRYDPGKAGEALFALANIPDACGGRKAGQKKTIAAALRISKHAL